MQTTELLNESVGENLDALVTIDIRGYGVPRSLYQEARAQQGGPLILGAAQGLQDAVSKGRTVVIATGFVFPPWNTGELDGVVGACAIARAVEIGLGAKPILVVEPELVPAMLALVRTAGLQATTEAEQFANPNTALVIGFTKDPVTARTMSASILDLHDPAAVVSIERPGRDEAGRYRMGNGTDVTDLAAKVDTLFEQARGLGILTVAIGDLGNELGLGSLQPVVARRIPFGTQIAAAVSADRVIVAAVSDWAGYALAAAISFVSKSSQAAISPELLRQLLWKAVDVGLIDGSGYATPTVDGVGVEYNMRLVAMLADLTASPGATSGRFQRMFEIAAQLRSTN